MPLSALVGRRELMSGADSVGVDMGARGETLSLAAARAALDVYASEPVAERVAEVGRAVAAGLDAAARRERIPLRVVGHPARLEVEIDDVGGLPGRAALGLFVQGCLDRGVVTNGLVFPTAAHDAESVDTTARAAREALRIVRLASDGKTTELPPPFGPKTAGFLDDAEVVDGDLRVYGWILPRGGPPDEIELVDSDGRTAVAALFSRPDVAAAYPAIRGADRCGFWATIPGGDAGVAGATWTLRARRAGQIVFRCRLVAGLRSYKRAYPRELGDGCVAEI
jgi:hypothetical protein